MIDRSGRILVLRPDCTLPIARVAATHLRQEPLPLRLYYNETIFRAAKANAGHMSEVDQCGIELIGSPGRRADAEVVATALQALQSCGLQTYRIELGHAGFFKALADELETDAENIEITEEDMEAEMNRMAETYKMEIEKVKELLDDSQKEEIKKDLAIQKAIDLVTEAAAEA